MRKLQLIVCGGCLLVGTLAFGGDLTPPGVPEPTMHTLNEIWNKLDEIATSQGVLANRLAELDRRGPITLRLPGDVPLTLVRVSGGAFWMGSNDGDVGEKPVHPVWIGHDFYMGVTEVTQAQWLAVMGGWAGSPPDATYGVGENHPAYYVSWNDVAGAGGFLEKINSYLTTSGQAVAGKPLRLPSEAEWEYACRGGKQTAYSYGATADGAYMWYNVNNSPSGSKPVGQKLPNPFGLYDMHGNVYEWCQDWYHGSYVGAPSDGSAWETPCDVDRVFRGGYWGSHLSSCLSASRSANTAEPRIHIVGFRLLRTR